MTVPSNARSRARRSRRYLVLAPLCALAIGLVAYWIGLSAVHTVLLVICLLLIASASPITGVPVWMQFRRLPYDRKDGARREVSNLSWALYGDRRTLARPAVVRVHRSGVRACAHAGIDLDTGHGRERARDELGADALDFLTDPLARPLTAGHLSTLLSAFEKLDLTRA